MYKNHGHVMVKSAGTEPSARIRVNARMIQWADAIFVMERKHEQRLKEQFPKEIAGKNIVLLNIPDKYQYMDSELIERIGRSVSAYF